MGFLDTNGVTYLWGKVKELLNTRVPWSSVGVADGVARLDSSGKLLTSQMPSSVDDIFEYDTFDDFPKEGIGEKIYIAVDTNKTYRWSGSTYAEISPSITIGTTPSSAGRGDLTQTAYEHSQSEHAPVDARPNVQSDWDEVDPTSDAYIKNKPSLPVANGDSLGAVKTTSTVTSSEGYIACPIIEGVPYYKDTNISYSSITDEEIDAIFEDDETKEG